MAKAIKEIIIMLLICLVLMLLFAILFYEYIPSRKVIPEITTYQANDETQQLLSDTIDSQKDEKPIYTYEVTSSELKGFEKTNEYVPGKANPFASVSPDTQETKDPNTIKNNTTNTNKDNSNTTTTNTTDGNTNTYFKDSGTK